MKKWIKVQQPNKRKNWLTSYKDLRRRKKSGMQTKNSCILQPKIPRACTVVPKFINMVLRYVRSWISPVLLATMLLSPWLIFLHPSLDNQNIHHVLNLKSLADQLTDITVEEDEILNSHDVVALFTNTPVRAQYVRMPNTYDSYVLGWNSHFWQKKWVAQPNTYEWLLLSKSYRYWSSSLWNFISSLRKTRPMAISSKDNSTHGNFAQGQLDPRIFRPRTTRPTAISSKDNSTHGNFVQKQLDPRQFRPRTTRPTAISSIFNRGCLYKD